MGVLQGVDIATYDAAPSAIRDPSGLQETRSSPRGRSDEERLGYGKANGASLRSHNQADPGIIPRALSRVFEHMQGSMVSLDSGSPTDGSPKVMVSLLQIYNETVQVRNLCPCVCWGIGKTGYTVIDPLSLDT